MTREEFMNYHPNGQVRTTMLFQKALHEIMTTGEIDRIIDCTKGREKKNLKRFKEAYTAQDFKWYSLPFMVSSGAIESALLYRDILTYMMIHDDLKYYGEDLENGEDQ